MTPDEKLMLDLLMFAAENYVENGATPPFIRTMKRACKRLGVHYSPYGTILMNNIEVRKIEAGEGGAK